ncbi:MAG: hypothetical protein IMZ50_01955 [Candidatus Atribacteria bacterium]|nr:hypothetical protein [Candidatus Atribacteria bacterium]
MMVTTFVCYGNTRVAFVAWASMPDAGLAEWPLGVRAMERTTKTGLALAKDIQRDLSYLRGARLGKWPRLTIRTIIRSFRGKYGRGGCSHVRSLALGDVE